MIGIITMSAGGLVLILGAMFFKTSEKKEGLDGTETDQAIAVAAADNMLTNNERNKIHEVAKSDIDDDKVMQQTEDKVQNGIWAQGLN